WANHINNYIVPIIGPRRIDTVGIEAAEESRKVWKEDVSARMVNKVLTTAASIFDRQIGRAIHSNPFAQVDRLAELADLDEEDGVISESQVYSPRDLLKLIMAADGLYARTVLQTFAFTGMRHGEGLALQWPHVSFENK